VLVKRCRSSPQARCRRVPGGRAGVERGGVIPIRAPRHMHILLPSRLPCFENVAGVRPTRDFPPGCRASVMRAGPGAALVADASIDQLIQEGAAKKVADWTGRPRGFLLCSSSNVARFTMHLASRPRRVALVSAKRIDLQLFCLKLVIPPLTRLRKAAASYPVN